MSIYDAKRLYHILTINQQTAIVGLFRARKFPTNNSRNVDLGVLWDIIGSDSNVGTKRSTIRSQAERIRLFVNQFETFVTRTGTATEIDNLGTNNTSTFHNESISIVFTDRTDSTSTTGLHGNLFATRVICRLSNPIVGESRRGLQLLTGFLLAALGSLLGGLLGSLLGSGLL